MRGYFRQTLTAMSALLIAFQLVTVTAGAQQDTGSGLQVSPATRPVQLIPGQSETVIFTVTNPTPSTITVSPIVYDFSADEETGRAILNIDQTSISSRSIKNYVTGLESIQLESRESHKFEITISMPNEVVPGAYYGAIAFQALPGDDGSSSEGVAVAFNANVAPLLLVTVVGDATTSGEILGARAGALKDPGLQFTKSNLSLRSLFGSMPDAITVEVENTGDTFLEPLGTVIVKNMFGSEIVINVNDSIIKGQVLPGAKRTYISKMGQKVAGSDELKTIGGFGRFTVTGGVGLINGGSTTDITFTFWVIPTWLWVLLAVTVFTVTGAGYGVFRKIRG